MAKINDELKRKLEREVGPEFCASAQRMQLKFMQQFIKEFEGGDLNSAARTLESIDFVSSAISRTCEREQKA